MAAAAPDDPRFLDGDALRVARVKALEKAFAVALTPDEAARCTSIEETTAVLVARVGAVPGAGNLRAGALAAVREALREVARADRESVDESTPLAPFFPRWRRARRWRTLGRELACALPPVQATPLHIYVLAPAVALQCVWFWSYPRDRIVDESTMAFSVTLAALGAVVLLGAGLLFRMPERLTHVARLVNWLVAFRPGAYRAGTDWTVGQVEEAVGAVHGLRFYLPRCSRWLTLQGVVFLLWFALAGTSLALCFLGLTSSVVAS